MAYDYKHIYQCTLQSLLDGKLCREDMIAMIEYYKRKQDFEYCNALQKAWQRHQSIKHNVRDIYYDLAKRKN